MAVEHEECGVSHGWEVRFHAFISGNGREHRVVEGHKGRDAVVGSNEIFGGEIREGWIECTGDVIDAGGTGFEEVGPVVRAFARAGVQIEVDKKATGVEREVAQNEGGRVRVDRYIPEAGLAGCIAGLYSDQELLSKTPQAARTG